MYGRLVMRLEKIMNNITTVTLLLPEEEAKKWVMFQKYYDVFSLIMDRKVFEIKGGSATLHFDAEGQLQAINRSDTLWNRRFDIPIQ